MDRAGLSASTAAHALLVLPWWFPQNHSFHCNRYLKYPILLYFTPIGQNPQDVSCNSASGKETARIQAGGEEEANSTWPVCHLSALLLPGVWTRQRWAWQEGWGGTASRCSFSLALLGPALRQRTTSPFLPCGDGVRPPTLTVGSAHMKCIRLPSVPHLTLHLNQSPGLEKESGIRDHSVVFIRRNSSLSRRLSTGNL